MPLIQSVRAWLARRKGGSAAAAVPAPTPTPTRLVELRPVPTSTAPARAFAGPRYLVVMLDGDEQYELHSGDDGTEALEAWEACEASDVAGRFLFFDRQHCRGEFTR